MMYSSYSALQRRQLTKQVYTDTQSSYLLVYAPGRHLALENSLANQLHRKFRLVTQLEGQLTDAVAGVLLVSEDLECTSTALTYFADALRTRTFEPDEPNYTPRISAVVYADGSYQMSILKSADGNGDSVQRYFFDYPQPVAGEGHFISTYKHNGNPIPSFEGEPLRFACPRTIGDFAHDMWSSLNLDNKVSLFARVIDLDTGESGDMIFNKYDPVCSDFDDPEEPELLPEELELLKKLDAEEE